MSKNWFTLYLLFVLPALAMAQGPSTWSGGHFGVKVGPTVSALAVSGITPNIPKNGIDFHFGLMYRYRLNRFVVQPEVLYSVRGGNFKVNRLGGGTDITYNNYNYVSVPLMLGYIPTEGLTLQAGPEFSYALNSPASGGPSVKNDVGIAVGAHYDFLDMLDKFSLHLRYIHGLNDVSGNPLAVYKNRTLQLGLVYNLYPKKKK